MGAWKLPTSKLPTCKWLNRQGFLKPEPATKRFVDCLGCVVGTTCPKRVQLPQIYGGARSQHTIPIMEFRVVYHYRHAGVNRI